MILSKQIAKEFIENKSPIDDFTWHDDVIKSLSESGGYERYCILEENKSGKLFRFIYEQKENGANIYYKDVQLTPVEKTEMTVSVYTEIEAE